MVLHYSASLWENKRVIHPRRGGQMDVGREIRRLREEKGWSQAKLAGAADMGVSGISQIETGARNPSAVTLSKIAEALGVGVADLFPKAPAPSPELPFNSLEEKRRDETPDAPIVKESRAEMSIGRITVQVQIR